MYNDIEETVHEEIDQCFNIGTMIEIIESNSFMGSNKIYNRALTKIKIYDIM